MTVRMARPGRLLLALWSISLLAFAAACSKPASNVAPSGTMNVLGPVPAFEPNALPLDWIIEGKAGRGISSGDALSQLGIEHGPATLRRSSGPAGGRVSRRQPEIPGPGRHGPGLAR